jgi:hypothetical protein
MKLPITLRKRFIPEMILMAGLLCCHPLPAQELNCQVSVLTPLIQASDKRIYNTLQQSIAEFMNNTSWTDDHFLHHERIRCVLQITIDERVSNDEFKGSIQVQLSRPVYKSNYDSPVFTFKDNDFSFRYLEYQNIEFNQTGSNPNLSAVLAFYAYIILGIDYDSFSLLGGSPYFKKAQQIVANMQTAPERGWKQFESTRNRYWLAESFNDPIFRPVRELYYHYHRKGLDQMVNKKEEALQNIIGSLQALQKLHREKPTSFLIQTLFDAKADEVVNILSGTSHDTRMRMYNLLSEINPANTLKYQAILRN